MPPLIALSNGTGYTEVPINPGVVVQVGSTYGTQGSQSKWRARFMDTRVMPTTGLDPHVPIWNYLAPALWHERVVNHPSDVVLQTAKPYGAVAFTPPGPAQSTANAALDASTAASAAGSANTASKAIL